LQELRSALWQTLPAASDRPGIVTGRWQRRGEGTPGRATEEWRIEPEVAPDPPPAPMPRRRSRPGRSEDLAGRRRAWPDHALGAIAGAALCAWIARHLLATSLVAPAVLALLAGLVIAALPRLGWLALSAGIGAGAIAEGRPGAALLFLLAAILPAFVMPRDGAAWTLPAGGPALALIGLGGAWPALAARASGIWRRAALGGIGWIWLLMAAPVMGAGLYVRAPSGLAAQPGWPSSLHGTVALVLRPILTSGALAAAPVWALAAVTLPPLVRNRRPTAALALAAAWALGVVVAVQAAIGLADTSSWTLGSGPALIGVIASVAVVAAPSFRDALRVPRARPGLS
jgi:hypothetical protein